MAPVKPVAQTQVPLAWAVPCPLQVEASEYWQVEPAWPARQVQIPVPPSQVPWPPQVCVVPPVQAPDPQVSPLVQALPSLQVLPLARLPHVPLLDAPAATLQATQSVVDPPPQAVLQQTPSEQ